MKQNLDNTKTLLNLPSIVRALLQSDALGQSTMLKPGQFINSQDLLTNELNPKKKKKKKFQKASCADLRISFRFKIKAQKGLLVILSSICYFYILLPR